MRNIIKSLFYLAGLAGPGLFAGACNKPAPIHLAQERDDLHAPGL